MSGQTLADVLGEHAFCGDRYCGTMSAKYRTTRCTDCADTVEAARAAVTAWIGERLAGAREDVRRALPGLLIDEYGEDRETWAELGSTRRISDAALDVVRQALGIEVQG